MINYSEHPVFLTADPLDGQLSADEVNRVRSLLEKLPIDGPVHVERAHGDAELAQLARSILASHRDIEEKFADQVTNDPSIELLMQLFMARVRGEMMTVSEACAATSSPPTTALRRLAALTEQGHIIRIPHRHDKRTVFVKLSDCATGMMRTWLESTRAAI